MNASRTLIATLVFLALGVGVAHADARACREDTTALRALLSERHGGPSAERITALCTDSAEALTVVATTPARQIERLRAIFAIAYFPSDAVRTTLAGLALNREESASVRRNALLALQRATESDTRLLVETSRTALRDADPHVRAAAVRCLGPIASARTDLQAALRTERESFVRERISAVLGAPRVGTPSAPDATSR